MGKVIPFRGRAQRESIRKAIETRARRKELVAMSQQLAPLHRYTATQLERLFWDVVEWIRALPQNHPNLSLARSLELNIASEYKRRRQDDPREAADKHIERVLDEAFGHYGRSRVDE